MLCYAHASSLNSWAPDPVDSVVASASSPVTSPPAPPPADSTNSIRSLRGRRLGSPHKSQDQSPWTIMPSAKSRNITSTSATAVIRRKNSRDNNFRPVNATRALTGSKQDPDDALVNGEFVSKKVIVALSCEPEETVVKFNFTNPFRGVIQAGGSHSPCRIKGDGRKYYALAVPHNSCGTKHVTAHMGQEVTGVNLQNPPYA